MCVCVCIEWFLFVGVAAGDLPLFGWRAGALVPQLPANNDAMNDDDYHDEMKKLNKGNPNCFFGVRNVYDIKYNFFFKKKKIDFNFHFLFFFSLSGVFAHQLVLTME